MTNGIDEERSGRGVGTLQGTAFFLLAGTASLALGVTNMFDLRRVFDVVMVSICFTAGFGMVGVGLAAVRGGRLTVTRGVPGALLVGVVAGVIGGGMLYRVLWQHRPLVDWSDAWRQLPLHALVVLAWGATRLVGRRRATNRLDA